MNAFALTRRIPVGLGSVGEPHREQMGCQGEVQNAHAGYTNRVQQGGAPRAHVRALHAQVPLPHGGLPPAPGARTEIPRAARRTDHLMHPLVRARGAAGITHTQHMAHTPPRHWQRYRSASHSQKCTRTLRFHAPPRVAGPSVLRPGSRRSAGAEVHLHPSPQVERRKQRQSRLAALPSLPPILWHELVNQLSKSEIIFFFDGQRQKFHFLSTLKKMI